MTIGLELGCVIDEIGDKAFVNAIHSTILIKLESNKVGSVYPTIQKMLSYKPITFNENSLLALEMNRLRGGLRSLPTSSIVWNSSNIYAKPPWGSNISSHITSMENYFVTSTGRDVLNLFDEAILHQQEIKENMKLIEF